MANPLKIKYSGETFNGLQVMTNEEMDYSVYQILTEFVANTGAGNIVVSAAQTLDDDQVLYFDGLSNTAKITGTLEIKDMAISDTTIYFDVERFLNMV